MPDRARHGVIVLAAGQSQRLGQAKQLLTIDGETLLHRAVRFALETDPVDCIVVFGANAANMRANLAGLAYRDMQCPDYAHGLSASLRCGLAALDPRCAGALVTLTDQPALDAEHLCALRDLWRGDPDSAAASGYANTLGVPALLPRAWFDELLHHDGDRGARDLLRSRPDQVRLIDAPQLALDLDSPADLALWRSPDSSS